MDIGYALHQRQFESNVVSFNGGEEELGEEQDYYEDIQQHQRGEEDIGNAGNEIKQSLNRHNRHSSGKLFVGGVSWETTEEAFANYFSKYGEIADSVIMMDRHSGRPRGFGFVTFADPAVTDRVLEEDHVIDGRMVEVKRTVPRGDMEVKGAMRTKKIFVGGLPSSLTEDELKEYFSLYGGIVQHQIMLDHKTGRSRGFGFVTFDSEDAVDQIFSEGKTHELGGKQVEIKKAEPKRTGSDYNSAAKSYTGFGSGSSGHGPGHSSGSRYGGKMDRGYGGYGSYDCYAGYGGYGGGYAGNTAGFYGGYGYGFGFGGLMMYGSGGYGGSSYGTSNGYGAATGYGGGKGFGRSNGGSSGNGYGNEAAVTGAYGGGKGYGGGANGGGGAATGRYHPYRK